LIEISERPTAIHDARMIFPVAVGRSELLNFSVLVQALGELSVFDIRNFIAANPTALVPTTPEELQEREAERVRQHIQMLLNADR